MNEYRVKVTVRNNLLLSAIEKFCGVSGFGAQAKFCRETGISPITLNSLVGMRDAPIGPDGCFSQTAKQLMEVLGACPSDLWTDKQLCTRISKSTGERTVSESALQAMIEGAEEQMTLPDPLEQAHRTTVENLVSSVLENLSPRMRKVIRMRYGIGLDQSYTLDDIAERLGVTRERIRQIEWGALRKLRNKANSTLLLGATL